MKWAAWADKGQLPGPAVLKRAVRKVSARRGGRRGRDGAGARRCRAQDAAPGVLGAPRALRKRPRVAQARSSSPGPAGHPARVPARRVDGHLGRQQEEAPVRGRLLLVHGHRGAAVACAAPDHAGEQPQPRPAAAAPAPAARRPAGSEAGTPPPGSPWQRAADRRPIASGSLPGSAPGPARLPARARRRAASPPPPPPANPWAPAPPPAARTCRAPTPRTSGSPTLRGSRRSSAC